jgi:hypothetical protein
MSLPIVGNWVQKSEKVKAPKAEKSGEEMLNNPGSGAAHLADEKQQLEEKLSGAQPTTGAENGPRNAENGIAVNASERQYVQMEEEDNEIREHLKRRSRRCCFFSICA